MDKLKYLIEYLLGENPEYRGAKIPDDGGERFRLFRGLVNVRAPKPISEDFLTVQDEFLRAEISKKGITDADDLPRNRHGISLWQGDITTLKCGCIVNTANSALLGCFCPCHGCIDNAIHTFAGVQLRLKCAEFIRNHEGRKTLYLELGVGFNTPAIIKYPFWKMTAANPKAEYACINRGEVYCPREIENRSILVDGDIAGILQIV